MTPLTDAQATILTPEQLATIEAAHGVYDGVGWHTVEKMLASHRALTTRLAEAEQTIARMTENIEGEIARIDKERNDLAFDLVAEQAAHAAAQATIERLRSVFVLDQQYVEHCRRCEVCRSSEDFCFEGDQMMTRLEEAKHAALAPPAPEADDAR